MKKAFFFLLFSAIVLSISSVSHAAVEPPGKESKIKMTQFALFEIASLPVITSQSGPQARHVITLSNYTGQSSINHYTSSCKPQSTFKEAIMRKKTIVIPIRKYQGSATYARHPSKETIEAVNKMAELAYRMKIPPDKLPEEKGI